MGGASEDPDVYRDREVWLVVIAQDPFQCARPSLAPGVPGWPRRWCFGVYVATDGHAYYGGGNGPSQGDWPPFLPQTERSGDHPMTAAHAGASPGAWRSSSWPRPRAAAPPC
jgi:hypothetical protein